jgi:steroid delta-isomerase-like uncharacterized protein
MQTELNQTAEKAVAHRFYDVMSGGPVDAFADVCSPDLVGHGGAGANLEELKANVAAFLVPFPDLKAELKHVVQEGDIVSVWIRYVGTHQDSFAGVPATGRQVRFAGWDLMRVRNGSIVELTQYCDLFTLMSQIGALPTAAPPEGVTVSG